MSSDFEPFVTNCLELTKKQKGEICALLTYNLNLHPSMIVYLEAYLDKHLQTHIEHFSKLTGIQLYFDIKEKAVILQEILKKQGLLNSKIASDLYFKNEC